VVDAEVETMVVITWTQVSLDNRPIRWRYDDVSAYYDPYAYSSYYYGSYYNYSGRSYRGRGP
jgi:hypothetical protein